MIPTYIILHCSDSPQGRGDNALSIHNWHKERGFDGIGYNFVVLEDGTIQNGRPKYWQGAHTKGYNHKSLGVCMIGEKYFSSTQLQATTQLIKKLIKEFNIPPDNVLGHYETEQSNGKTCPNYPMEIFRESLND